MRVEYVFSQATIMKELPPVKYFEKITARRHRPESKRVTRQFHIFDNIDYRFSVSIHILQT